MVDCHNFISTVRYRRFQKLAKLLQVFEVVIVLAFLSWSSSHFLAAVETVKICSKYILESSPCVSNPHVIFLIGNVIIVTLHILSRHIDAGNSSDVSDSYDGYINENLRRLPIAAAESTPLTEEIIVEEEKQSVCEENVNETESIPVKEPKQREKFERTMLEKFYHDISVKPKKELQRSETEVRQVVLTSNGRRMSRKASTFETVDSLSSEEFRLRVEAFIEKQQKFLRQQRIYCKH